MTRGVSWFFVAPLVLLGLSGCQFSLEQREPWRAEAEERCLAEGLVKSSAYTTPIREIDGRGTCGMDHPFKVSGLAEGQVALSPVATLACPVTASLDRWMVESVQPAAMSWFGQPVARIKQISAYSCRNMNGARTGKISEHAYGNALDIAAFTLADGRNVVVKTGWKGAPDEQGFLRTVQASACERFTTVLAPGSNIYHYDHIHVDLMRRSSGRGICQPAPRVPTPPMGSPMARSLPPAGAYPPPPLPTAAGAPMDAAPEEEFEPSDYGHGVDPNYQSPSQAPNYPAQQPYPAPTYQAPPRQPQPAGYPGGYNPGGYLPPAPMPQNNGYPPQGQPYPGNPYPAQPSYPRPSGPLPPAGVPLVRWQKGADPVVTGSATRSYAPEPKRINPFTFAEPIDLPRAIPGED